MPMMPFIARARTLGLSMALATAGLGVVATVPASAVGPTTWHVQAGNADDPTGMSVALEVTAFYNAHTFVHPGDHVLFRPVFGHTVTFNPIRIPGVPTFAYGNPAFPAGPTGNTLRFGNRNGGALLNSGAFATPPPPGAPPPGPGGPPPAPPTFTLNIGSDAAGPSVGEDGGRGTTYQFFCMFHRDMTGFITVLPAGRELPSTDASNQVRAQRAMEADLARGKRALAKASRDADDNHVAAGLGISSIQRAGAVDILRFAPATIEINAGESVTWVNEDINAPHTVTFGTERAGPGLLPYGGTTISSTSAQVSSGFLISQELIDYVNAGSLLPPGFVVTRQVTFTFLKPGIYHYICVLHDDLGMKGTVIVRAED